MAEFINPQEGFFKEGYFPNVGNTMLEVYRLLTIFLASKNFASLLTNYPGEGFDPIYKVQEVEEDEITRLLLTLSITARVIDDRENLIFKNISSPCGTLQANLDNETVIQLNLREACNKIIHAKKIHFDVEGRDMLAYLNPFIYIYGESSNGRAWKATLDIITFAKEYSLVLSKV
ncbi:hypothetical protein [Methylotenera sp.]|uniref:hypothetical protein n=1 Tax=Methylotenera sp. TaxID=2051956 RepID=UPI002486EE50|nr:hypothetical protein [Methylotenera sp.]MDI1361844.1 hypothetical protein [Methylotenera sp.]